MEAGLARREGLEVPAASVQERVLVAARWRYREVELTRPLPDGGGRVAEASPPTLRPLPTFHRQLDTWSGDSDLRVFSITGGRLSAHLDFEQT